jgi:hypothetical protein
VVRCARDATLVVVAPSQGRGHAGLLRHGSARVRARECRDGSVIELERAAHVQEPQHAQRAVVVAVLAGRDVRRPQPVDERLFRRLAANRNRAARCTRIAPRCRTLVSSSRSRGCCS